MRTLMSWNWGRHDKEVEAAAQAPIRKPIETMPADQYKGSLGELDWLIAKGEAKIVRKGNRSVIEFYS